MHRYELRAQAGGSELLVYGNIGEDPWADESNDAKTIVDKLSAMQGPLTVRINSYGGSVADGLAIHNALKRYPGGVEVVIDAVAYSIASLIAMGGKTISAAKNSLLMIHAPEGGAMGDADDMRNYADLLDRASEAMASSYAPRIGIEKARELVAPGAIQYFTADEALAEGLIDSIDEAVDVEPMVAMLSADQRPFQLPAAQRRPTGGQTMPTKEATAGAGTPSPDTNNLVTQHSKTVEAAQAAGAQAEAARRNTIETVFSGYYDGDPLSPITAAFEQCRDDVTCDELRAQKTLLAVLREQTARPVVAAQQYGIDVGTTPPPRASAHMGGAAIVTADQHDKRAEALSKALQIKAGLIQDRKVIDDERKGELLALSLTDVMAGELRTAGLPVAGMREDIVRAYLKHLPVLAAGPSHGSDHLPTVLGNIANLSAMQGWDGSEETWSQWTQSGTLNNYQTATRANIALLDKLQKMLENQEWEYGDATDVKQRITGYFYGLKYSVSIQALVNDELGELSRAMQGWGESGSATVGDVVYAALLTAGTGGFGQSMDEDSQILFHADHANYVASGSGAAPSEATLNTARTAMVNATDPNGRKVAARPRFLLHGSALFSTVRKVLASQELQSVTVDGATGATVLSGSVNSVQAMNLAPVEEYRLNATEWILAAARRTVEVAGVGGPVTPRAEQSMVSNVPGLTYELSMPFGVAALDYRGLYLNAGV